MKIINHKMKYGPETNDNEYRLYFLGDVHLGSITVDKEALQRDIDEILNHGPERAGVILMGDMGDYISPYGDRRYDSSNVDASIIDLYSGESVERQTVEALVEFFKPLADAGQILCILGGNHGLQNKSNGEYTRWDWFFAEKLGLEHLFCGYSAFVRLQFEAERGGAHRSIVAHVHHGHQGGRSKGAKVNQLEKDMSWLVEADFIVRGHSHNLLATPFMKTKLNQRATDIVYSKVIVGHSGSYLQSLKVGTETYAERANYRPEPMGCLKTWITFDDTNYEIFAGV